MGGSRKFSDEMVYSAIMTNLGVTTMKTCKLSEIINILLRRT